jgi:U3 small nucleolar RNA-associated protein 10
VEVLETLIATSTVPLSVLEILTTELLSIAAKPDCEAQNLLLARRLLSLIQQRHPIILRKAAETLCDDDDDDESLKDAVEQQIISISTVN